MYPEFEEIVPLDTNVDYLCAVLELALVAYRSAGHRKLFVLCNCS